MSIGPEQRSRLHQAQLRGLLRVHWPDVGPATSPYPSGASAIAGSVGWVLVTATTPRSLGGALVWSLAHGCDELHVLVDDHGGLLARLASRFDVPVTVWQVDGTDVARVESDRAPDRVDLLGGPHEQGLDAGDDLAALAAAGLEVVVEDGIVRFEVLGLEVGRYEEGPDGGPPQLQSGVGRFDREMSAMLHAHDAPVPTVLAAADFVRSHRRPGGPPHPLRDMSRERWIRRVVLERPDLVGATRLEPVGTSLPRPNLRDSWPAMAWGVGSDGRALAVVCTAGIDLDAIPLAADTRAVLDPDADLVVVSVEPLPDAVRTVAAHVAGETRFVVVAPPWMDAGDRPAGAPGGSR